LVLGRLVSDFILSTFITPCVFLNIMTEVLEEDIPKVTAHMTNDHLRILSLFDGFEMTFNQDLIHRLESLYAFKWHIEKHLFVEERAIFSSLKVDKDIGEELNLFLELSKQHIEIINEIKKLYQNLKNDIDIDTIKLRDLLNQHFNFEEKVAYPKLDEIITETEKNLLLNQIQDIIYEV